MRRLSLTAALVVLGALVFTASAPACSCAPRKPSEALQQSDAAIVGRLVKVMPRGALHADYRYEVQKVYRGRKRIERDQMLNVRSARRAAACALPRRLDHRYGLFLSRVNGRWTSSICGVVEPAKLAEAAKRPARRAGGGARTSAGPSCSQGAP